MEYVIPLRWVFTQPRIKRPRKAVEEVRKFVKKHARAKDGEIVITQDVNHAIWENSKNIPRRLAVLLRKYDGSVYVYMQGSAQIEADKKLRELKKKKGKEKGEVAEKKKEKTEEEKAAEEEAEEKKREKRAKELAAERSAIKRKTKATQE